MAICSSPSSSSSSSSSTSSFGSSNTAKAWIIHGIVAGVAIAAAVGARAYMTRFSKFRSRVVGIIPARFASSRFEGKPLVQILGKPMIQVDPFASTLPITLLFFFKFESSFAVCVLFLRLCSIHSLASLILMIINRLINTRATMVHSLLFLLLIKIKLNYVFSPPDQRSKWHWTGSLKHYKWRKNSIKGS